MTFSLVPIARLLFAEAEESGTATIGRANEGAMGNKPTRVLFAGLKNTGKTRLYSQLAGRPVTDVYIPTEACDECDIVLQKRGNKVLHLTDVPGDYIRRRQWGVHYSSTDAVVFFIDASTLQRRMQEAATAFWMIMSDRRMRDVPALVLLTKCDLLPASVSHEEVAALVKDRLRIDDVRLNARVVPVSLVERPNLAGPLAWLEGAVEEMSK